MCLATGSLWGKPMWGTWWVWDARLTSVLVLFFLWLGHAALVRAFDDAERGARMGAILALVGAVNVPIVKFSVDWWNTLHQPASVTRLNAPGLHVDILYPLLVCALGFTLAFMALVLARTRAAVMERRIRALQMAAARGGRRWHDDALAPYHRQLRAGGRRLPGDGPRHDGPPCRGEAPSGPTRSPRPRGAPRILA